MRSIQFSSGQYYHIYNRGVDKRKIFLRFGHYRRFYFTIKRILDTGSATERLIQRQGLALKSKVEIISYCLMPNHYHFVLYQKEDQGITEFMHHLNTSYTMFFNLNQKRTGRLFEYTFKAKHVPSDELFLHIHRYIHVNPVIAGLVASPELWPWSSYLEAIGEKQEKICNSEKILSHFNSEHSIEDYKNFVNNQLAYTRLLHDTEETKDEDTLFL